MLSTRARQTLITAVGNETSIGNEVALAIDSNTSGRAAAAAVTPSGSVAALVGVDGTGSNAAPLAGTNTRFTNIEAKLDAVLAALAAAPKQNPLN